MTIFNTGSKNPTFLNDDIVRDARPEDCVRSCWAVTCDPNALSLDLSILDNFTNKQIEDWTMHPHNNDGHISPLDPNPPEELIIIPELISGIDDNNTTTTIYTDRDAANAAYDAYFDKLKSFDLAIAEYVNNRNFNPNNANMIYHALTFLMRNTDVGATITQIPNCQDANGNKCKEDDELIDSVLVDYCVTDTNEGVIKCIKRSETYPGDPDTTNEVDSCLDCKGYMVCCDNGIPRLVFAQSILAANELTNCTLYLSQSEAIQALKDARKVTGWYRALELVDGTYLCRKGYEYCNGPVYDNYYSCRDVTEPTSVTSAPTPSP